ncbi:unnamed protein product [Mucor hiemalis]
MKEMNGKHRFVYLDSCGCVFAEQVLKEVATKECLTCGKAFENANIIVINPNKDELEPMKKVLEEKKAKAKAERKAKKAENKKNGGTQDKKRKRESELSDMPIKKTSSIQSSAAAAVMGKVAQELAEKQKKNTMSSAVKSIYGSKDQKENGNYLTKGTFTRY